MLPRRLKFFLSILLFAVVFFWPSASDVSACTYQATITGNHVDFAITSELDKLAVIQYIRQSGSAFVTKMYSPDIGASWTYFDDPRCDVGLPTPIACRQNRGAGLGTGAFWQWYSDGAYHLMPGGVYGLDFDSPPTYESLGIMYGVLPGTTGEAWKFCTRANTPPVTKTVFLPGFGGSWNANAFAACSFDNNPANWSLAPYAEFAYQPLLTALSESGWEVKPYYYDWKMRLGNSIPVLSSFINSNSLSDEKVNIIGHSMGGLLSAAYLTENGPNKTNSLLTAGSPLRGAVQSYPAWSGGDVWDDNFITRVATTLYLKHCGGIRSNDRETIRTFIPSIQSFLPRFFDYLKQFKTEIFKPWHLMSVYNDWLGTHTLNFHDVKFGTLAGTGFDTLSGISVRERNKRDAELGNWVDGKPAGKTTTTEGDGTVLLYSSFFDLPNSSIINQNHTGLVNSVEGMAKILDFLGTPPASPLSSPSQSAPDSALILIGNPASFSVTDEKGSIKRDKDGMIILPNPTSGNYRLSLTPQSERTLFVVAQFLPNGQVLYKEYNLVNRLPKFKTLKFDLANPAEDILR